MLNTVTRCGGNLLFNSTMCHGLCSTSQTGKAVYLWNWIWPDSGELILGGFQTKLASAQILSSGQTLPFRQDEYRIRLQNLPESSPDRTMGAAVIRLTFEEPPGISSGKPLSATLPVYFLNDGVALG